MLDYEPENGTEEDLATIQSALLEMVIPVVPELLHRNGKKYSKNKFIIFRPDRGWRNRHRTTRYRAFDEYSTNAARCFFYLIDISEELQIQTLLVLIAAKTLERKGITQIVRRSLGKGTLGEQAWPSGFGEEASLHSA